MSANILGFMLVVVIMFVAFWAYAETTFKKMNTTGISQMPPPPRVTPTIVIDDIVIGDATYFNNSAPEILIDVKKVQNGIVHFDKSGYVEAYSMSIEEFRAQHTKRTPTKITNN